MNLQVQYLSDNIKTDGIYGGLGDRHQQNPSTGSGTGVNYTLDLNAGLTQVLSDGTNTYLYGNGRIAQANSTTEYFIADTLGSVRQLTDPTASVTLTQSYAPYGEVTQSVGSGATAYQFTGELRDANGLIYLRARYYNPADGRFLSRDTWGGDYNRPVFLLIGHPLGLTLYRMLRESRLLSSWKPFGLDAESYSSDFHVLRKGFIPPDARCFTEKTL